MTLGPCGCMSNAYPTAANGVYDSTHLVIVGSLFVTLETKAESEPQAQGKKNEQCTSV